MILTVLAGGQATAHVLEPIAVISSAEAAFMGHRAGDADEVAADGDQDVPHHHAACHDHGIGLAVAADHAPRAVATARAPHRGAYAALATADPNALLRPPRV